jgi:hypothetical protein
MTGNLTLTPSGFVSGTQTLGVINISSAGTGETRAIDIDGQWASGESKSISFIHGSNSSNFVGQINMLHNGTGSSLRFGKLYHGADSTAYPMTLTSTSTTTADLTINGGVTIDSGNGDQLLLDNAGERFTQISFSNNGSQEAAIWYDATDNYLVAHANAGDGFKVQTGGSNDRLTIDSSGNLTTNGTTLKSNSNAHNNFKLQASSTSTDVGLSHFCGNGSHGYQLYASGTSYGFLDGNWAQWDIQKVKNGQFKVDEGSGLQRVFNDAYHPNADAWTIARTLSLSGDASGSVSWDGSANASLSVTVANDSHSHKIIKTSGNYVWSNSTTAGNYPTIDGSPGIQTSFVRSADGWPDYGSVLHVGARGGSDAGGDFQLYCGHGSGNGGNYLRVRNADNSASPTDSWTAWRTVWDSGNDGSGSGLDADTVDGIQGATLRDGSYSNNYYVNALYHDEWVRNHTNNNGHYWDTTGWHLYPKDVDDFYVRAGAGGSSCALAMTVGNETARGYVYANTSNEVGFLNSSRSWSLKVDNSGNVTPTGTVDGRDVAADGTKLDTIATNANNYSFPYTVSASASNSTVVQRHSSGYIFANYFNTTPNTVTSGVTQICVETGNDGYIRHGTAAAVRSFLNVADGANNYSLPASPTVTDLYVGSGIYHNGDTNTNMTFGTDIITIAAGGSAEITINTTGVRLGDTGNGYFQPVSGSYGSIQIDGGAHNGWEGYSIGGRIVFMHDNGNTSGIYNDVDDEWQFWCTRNGGARMYYNGSSKIETTNTGVTVSGDVNSTSDIRYKKNIETIDSALEKVQSLRGVTFDWDNDAFTEDENTKKPNFTARATGVIAQDVEKVLPEAVRENEDGFKNVAYGNMVGLLIEAIKEQQTQIDELKVQLNG